VPLQRQCQTGRQAFQQRLRLQSAKCKMTSSNIVFNQLQLKPVVCMASQAPVLNSFAKKLVDTSGDPRELQWCYQHLSLAVVWENAASMLACMQLKSDFSCSQCTNQYFCLPLAIASMHSYCLLNVNAFYIFYWRPYRCYFTHWLIITITIKIDHCIAYGDSTTLWYVKLRLKLLKQQNIGLSNQCHIILKWV